MFGEGLERLGEVHSCGICRRSTAGRERFDAVTSERVGDELDQTFHRGLLVAAAQIIESLNHWLIESLTHGIAFLALPGLCFALLQDSGEVHRKPPISEDGGPVREGGMVTSATVRIPGSGRHGSCFKRAYGMHKVLQYVVPVNREPLYIVSKSVK